MTTNPEALNSDLENSGLWFIRNALRFLAKDVKEKVDPSLKEAPYEKNWAIIFKFESKWRTFQVVTRKEWNTYTVRINEFKYMKKLWRESWENIWTQSFTANNESSFKSWFWTALDNLIGKEREKLPKTSGVVYGLLDKHNSSNQWNWNNKWNSKESSGESSEKTEKTNLREKPVDLKYNEKNKGKIEDVNYPTNARSIEWRITRCLRFKSITDAVENRYWIPRWLLMAMMAQEWWWDPTVINQKNSKDPRKTCDWWAGLIHIQAINAANYWLNTLPRSTTDMVDYKHGERLEAAKRNNNNNLAKLSALDDRFNPVLSVDVAARYLMDFCGWKNKKSWDERMNAVCKYAWRGMSDYWYSVIVYWTTINGVRGIPMPTFSNEITKVVKWEWSAMVNWKRENTKNCISKTRQAIDNLNPTLDGEIVSLDDYYKYEKWQWNNYGLQAYIDHNKKHPYVK